MLSRDRGCCLGSGFKSRAAYDGRSPFLTRTCLNWGHVRERFGGSEISPPFGSLLLRLEFHNLNNLFNSLQTTEGEVIMRVAL